MAERNSDSPWRLGPDRRVQPDQTLHAVELR